MDKMENITRRVCKTPHLGLRNNLFGGELLSWFDVDGLVFCSEKCDTSDLVTVSMNAKFVAAVKIKNIVYTYGKITSLGKTSVTCELVARKHDVETGKEKEVGRAEIVFVRVDSEGEPRMFSDRIREKLGFKPINEGK